MDMPTVSAMTVLMAPTPRLIRRPKTMAESMSRPCESVPSQNVWLPSKVVPPGGSTLFVDAVIMRVVDLQLSFPAILIALILLAALGKGVDKVIIALIIVQWAYYARTVRGTALVERRKEYIEAATCLALSHRRIRVILSLTSPLQSGPVKTG